MGHLYSQSVTVVRAPLVSDPYGGSERDWANATRTILPGVDVQPAESAETLGDRQTVITGWQMRTQPGVDADIVATDRVEYDATTLMVDGEVGRYVRDSRVHHIEVRLKRVTG